MSLYEPCCQLLANFNDTMHRLCSNQKHLATNAFLSQLRILSKCNLTHKQCQYVPHLIVEYLDVHFHHVRCAVAGYTAALIAWFKSLLSCWQTSWKLNCLKKARKCTHDYKWEWPCVHCAWQKVLPSEKKVVNSDDVDSSEA